MSQEDKRYTRDTHIRVDREFDDKLEKLREFTGIKTNSKAIRFAVDFTMTVLPKHVGVEQSEENGKNSGKLAEAGVPAFHPDRVLHMEDAESLRHVCVELELLAESGRKERYLSDNQIDLMMAYLREITKRMKATFES